MDVNRDQVCWFVTKHPNHGSRCHDVLPDHAVTVHWGQMPRVLSVERYIRVNPEQPIASASKGFVRERWARLVNAGAAEPAPHGHPGSLDRGQSRFAFGPSVATSCSLTSTGTLSTRTTCPSGCVRRFVRRDRSSRVARAGYEPWPIASARSARHVRHPLTRERSHGDLGSGPHWTHDERDDQPLPQASKASGCTQPRLASTDARMHPGARSLPSGCPERGVTRFERSAGRRG